MVFRAGFLPTAAAPGTAALCGAAFLVLASSNGQARQVRHESVVQAPAFHHLARTTAGTITVSRLARAGHPRGVLVLYGPRIESQAALQAPLADRPAPPPHLDGVALRPMSHFGYEDTLREALAGGYGGALLDAAASDVPPQAFAPGPAFAPPLTAGNLVPAAYTASPCPLVIAVGPGTRHAPKTRIVSGQPACS